MIAAVGIGSNLGDRVANVEAAIHGLAAAGKVVAQSSFHETKPWGVNDQPDFINAAVLLETELEPRALLNALKAIEERLGRTAGARWGPRIVDLDILTYGDRRVDEPGLTIPHPHLFEREFALLPLAEIDGSFRKAVERMTKHGTDEAHKPMSGTVVDRVRALVEAFLETDLTRLRIEDANEDVIEIARSSPRQPAQAPVEPEKPAVSEKSADAIKADLVGILHFSKPAPKVGDVLNGDRELAYVEALGIRNPVRSLGSGKLTAVAARDGQAVEYGQVLFQIERHV